MVFLILASGGVLWLRLLVLDLGKPLPLLPLPLLPLLLLVFELLLSSKLLIVHSMLTVLTFIKPLAMFLQCTS